MKAEILHEKYTLCRLMGPKTYLVGTKTIERLESGFY